MMLSTAKGNITPGRRETNTPFHVRRRRTAPSVAGILMAFLLLGLLGWEGAAAASKGDPLRLLVLGDSLTAGYGLAAAAAFPSQLEKALKAEGHHVMVLNGGVSGDTTRGGLARLDWLLGENPDAVIVSLGANDALRGIDPTIAYANLDAIITRLKAEGIAVAIAGMKAPRNLGADYVAAFDAIYPRLSMEHDAPLYPFFLEGVAGKPSLNLGDGLHPNADGIAIMVDNMLPLARALVIRVCAAAAC